MKRLGHLVPILVACALAAGALALIWGSITNPSFWLTPNQRGQRLERAGDPEHAAASYDDPMRQGAAFYRAGDFKESAAAFARVGDANGAYNQGNALLMHGAYDDCIKAYDRALALRPGWKEAIENRELAVARKKRIEDVPDDGTGGQEKPDKIVVDDKAHGDRAKPVQINAGEPLSDDELRAAWLRRVQTKPADFLAAKFAYQLQQEGSKP